MGAFIDLTGQKFGKWAVLGLSGRRVQSLWHCRCECGKEKKGVLYGALVTGHSASCGCLRMDGDEEYRSVRDRMRRIYYSIRTRCFNASHPSYERYGKVGRVMCERWKNSFSAFKEDMWPSVTEREMSVDRIDNSGGYTCGKCAECQKNGWKMNCRWADRFTQANNKPPRGTVSWKGKTWRFIDIARQENVNYTSLRNRVVQMGKDVDEALQYLKGKGMVFIERAKGKRPSTSSLLAP